MALEGLTGLVDYNLFHIDQSEIQKKGCGNFYNQMCLSVPPYENVSKMSSSFRCPYLFFALSLLRWSRRLYSFCLQPAEKLTEWKRKGLRINFDHGTTTLGFKFKNGVILAVDSRATGGQFIGRYNCIVSFAENNELTNY